ncbi:unnamed protein product [Echinostoma caproni]|uniref:tRNA (uracil-O(2)-)-methyltransferase n=1 Tax=Echinostoma caproni TaxID=27848 RepID=A0A183AMJ5_9TREM|nr:unnamed protein product [Echinostoma caproni]
MAGDFFTRDWFLSVLQKKLTTWMLQKTQPLTMSLGLVDVILYHETYERLKEKYAHGIIQVCHLTIYFQCLWKGCSDVYFMDVGCGNGLLLITEGFRGVGVDIRRRRIWETYPESVRKNLLEMPLDPDQSPGFPDVTWFIGNHSDELTPWLPILAARSNPKCCVFALPCCPFGLFGKYNNLMHHTGIEDDSSGPLSSSNAIKPVHNRYGVYIQYLRGLFTACGFIPETDVLRIPSTKRICIIGRKLLTSQNDQIKRLAAVQETIERERQAATGKNGFVPRELKEPVRNCTQLPMDVKQTVSELVFSTLLSKAPDRLWLKSHNLVISDSLSVQTVDGRWWNPGVVTKSPAIRFIDGLYRTNVQTGERLSRSTGHLTLREVSELLNTDHLKLMKSQHGGLQTFLRNHHHMFEIRNGSVRLRWNPEQMAQIPSQNSVSLLSVPAKKRPMQRKDRSCWMFEHHPDGCPYPSEKCDFSHETANLSEPSSPIGEPMSKVRTSTEL